MIRLQNGLLETFKNKMDSHEFIDFKIGNTVLYVTGDLLPCQERISGL